MDFTSLLREKERILIHVKPNSRKTAVVGYDIEGDFFSVTVKAPPVDGKANDEIERYFSRLFKRKVTIKSGRSAKKKLLVVS